MAVSEKSKKLLEFAANAALLTVAVGSTAAGAYIGWKMGGQSFGGQGGPLASMYGVGTIGTIGLVAGVVIDVGLISAGKKAGIIYQDADNNIRIGRPQNGPKGQANNPAPKGPQ